MRHWLLPAAACVAASLASTGLQAQQTLSPRAPSTTHKAAPETNVARPIASTSGSSDEVQVVPSGFSAVYGDILCGAVCMHGKDGHSKKRDALLSAPAPLQLRGGAVPTGLWGYYDYQSNGGSPGYIYVNPANPDQIMVTYMNSTDAASVNDSRRVGYAYSSDGGQTWDANRTIDQIRLGYPVIQATDELPLIATHGDPGGGLRVFIYGAGSYTDVSGFFQYATFSPTTASGRTNILWPGFVLSKDMADGIVAATYQNQTGEFPGPVQVSTFSVEDGTPGSWKELGDSLVTSSSGGRNILARAASGKIGLAWYRFGTGEDGDNLYGVYFSESTDNGATWGEPRAVLTGENYFSDFNLNDDQDTLTAHWNIDLAYNGEDPHIVFTGSIHGFFRYENIVHWTPALGPRIIAIGNQVEGMGGYLLDTSRLPAHMPTLAYPTISVADDGEHIVVAFSAIKQTLNATQDTVIQTLDEANFSYYRLWGIGSNDGGRTWGTPFIIQDLAGEGTDSASLTYPSAPPNARMVGDNFELNLVFQGKRHGGISAFTNRSQVPATEEAHQYFQRFMAPPSLFPAPASVRNNVRSSVASSILSTTPNPASGRVETSYTIGSGGNVSIRLVDVTGRTLSTLFDGHRAVGTYSLGFDVSELESGSYFVVMNAGGVVSSKAVSVVR